MMLDRSFVVFVLVFDILCLDLSIWIFLLFRKFFLSLMFEINLVISNDFYFYLLYDVVLVRL